MSCLHSRCATLTSWRRSWTCSRMTWNTCAYSNPAFGQMFKMNAKTDADGRVSCIFATIYDSLELMYGDLCIDLDLHSKSGTLKYQRNKDDVLMDFM